MKNLAFTFLVLIFISPLTFGGIQESSESETHSVQANAVATKTNFVGNCYRSLASVPLLGIGIRATTWPLRRTAGRITAGVVLGIGASIAPIYPSENGKWIPAVTAYVNVRDIVSSEDFNETQIDALDRIGTLGSDRSRKAQAIDKEMNLFPQGVRVQNKEKANSK